MQSNNLVVAVLLLPVLAGSPLLAQGDIVLRKDGAKQRGVEVTEFKHTGLKATKGSDTIEIPGHMVLSVLWGDLPEAFISARSAMEKGEFDTAVQMFGEAASKAVRPLVKTDCEFFQIKAAVSAIGSDTGAAATASERAKTWLSSNADHWRVPEALLLSGRAQRLANKGDDAAVTLRELDERAVRDGFGAVWSARAKYELALTLMSNNKASEARTTFQSANSAADNALMNASPDDAELRSIKILARIGEGETFLSQKDYRRAESFFQAMCNSKEPGLGAAAWAGKGQAIFFGAVDSKSPEELRRAQFALAKASVLDSTASEASAKANYFLGRCQLELGPDREGDSFKARAQAYFQIVVDNYGESKWAIEAKASLQQ